MKKSKEIIGSPVISIADGVQIGTIKGLIVNPQQKSVEFLLLDEKNEDKELKGIPFRSAEAVGEFAVTVEDKNVLVNMLKVGILQELVQKGVDVIGTKVITKKGKYLGDVSEYSFDPATGKFDEFYYKSEGQVEKSITVQNVITIGKEVLVVGEDAGTITQAGRENLSNLEGKTGNFSPGDEGLPKEGSFSGAGEQSKPSDTFSNVKAPFVPEIKSNLDPAGIFVQRQRQSLIGKTLLKDIKSDDGEVIALENEVVTEELFNRIYAMGAQKLMELAVSVRE
jgi:uncharacterized protein YrrD